MNENLLKNYLLGIISGQKYSHFLIYLSAKVSLFSAFSMGDLRVGFASMFEIKLSRKRQRLTPKIKPARIIAGIDSRITSIKQVFFDMKIGMYFAIL
jgi:hypothetical protein